MNESLIVRPPDTMCSQPVALFVLSGQIPAKQDNIEDEQAVAAQVGRKSNQIAGSVPAQEYLGTWMGVV